EARSVHATLNGRPAVQTHLRDVTAQKAMEAQLAHQAFHDALTNLANRALFRDRVDHALARSSRQGAPPAVLFLDLDNFKSVSVGIAVARDDENAEALLRNADVAMYRAKSRGKGRYEVFEPAMHEVVRRRLELETQLRRAVEDCDRPDADPSTRPFLLHFQPI